MQRNDQTQECTDAERLDVLAQCLLVFAERGAAIRADQARARGASSPTDADATPQTSNAGGRA